MSPHNHRASFSTPQPALSASEWRAVKRDFLAVQDSACPRGLGRVLPGWRKARAVAPELAPLRDFLCERARHGSAQDELADQLVQQGYTPAQVAALSMIADL